MVHSDYLKTIEFAKHFNNLVPVNSIDDILNDLEEGETLTMKIVNARDLNMHRCYFAFLSFVYGYCSSSFQNQIHIKNFYKWIQTLKGDYDVLFEFKDGRQLLEYHSISFARMDEFKFNNYVKEQIPYIYDNLISAFYDKETASAIIETIEKEFEKYFSKLFKLHRRL